MDYLILHWQELLAAAALVLGTLTAFLAALYGLFLIIPGDQPDKTIKVILDFTKKISRKPLSLIFVLAMSLALTGCAGMDCLNKVGASEAVISGAYTQSIQLHKNNVIGNKDFLFAKTTIDSADVFVTRADALCGIDDPTALDYINQADILLMDVKAVLDGK